MKQYKRSLRAGAGPRPRACSACARSRASMIANTRSMPMDTPTAGTSLPLNMPTSVSYLRAAGAWGRGFGAASTAYAATWAPCVAWPPPAASAAGTPMAHGGVMQRNATPA